MFPDRLTRLQQKLGRPLPPEDRASISHLNDVPAALIEKARQLEDDDLAEALIAYYMTPGHRRYIPPYVQDVVVGTTPPALWRRGGILVPVFSLAEQLTLDRPALLAPVGGRFDVRVMPRQESWEAGTSWVGAPARPQPEADYLTPLPPGTVSISNLAVESVTDETVAIRRWIAARLAAVLRSVGRLDSVSDPSALGASLSPYESWSADALAALAALLRERRELSRATNEIP